MLMRFSFLNNVNYSHFSQVMSALQKGFNRLRQQVTETVDKTTNKTAALSTELVEVEENVRKLKIVYTDALKRAQESLVSENRVYT